MTAIGKRLRRARKRKNMAQAAAARKAKVSREAISSYETQGVIPPLDSAARLATAYDVTLDYLARGKKRSNE